MLVVKTIARIRREHFIKGKTIKQIARDLKVSRNTVRRQDENFCNPRSSYVIRRFGNCTGNATWPQKTGVGWS